MSIDAFRTVEVAQRARGARLGTGSIGERLSSWIAVLVPMVVTLVSLLLYLLTSWKFWYILGGLLVLCYALVWLQSVLAATQFGYMPLLAMIPLFLSVILPLFALGTAKR